MNGRPALRRSLIRVLLFKLAALIALWAFFFSPAHRIKPTPAEMAMHLFAATPN